MGVHSGRYGVVNGMATVKDWSINDTMQEAKYVASNTRGATGRKAGVRSWTGAFSGYGGLPPVLPGSLFSFVGYTAPDDDVSGNGSTYSGSAMVDSIAVNWNWANGALLDWAVNFSGHLALAHSLATYTDVSIPDPEPVCGTLIKYGATTWDNLVSAAFTLSRPSVPYVNSSTIVSSVCWTGRKAGVLDWTLAVTEQGNARESAIEIGANPVLKLYTTASLFWELTWAHVLGYSGLNVQREGGIVQRTVNFGMNGFVGGVVGSVKTPTPTTIWP